MRKFRKFEKKYVQISNTESEVQLLKEIIAPYDGVQFCRMLMYY